MYIYIYIYMYIYIYIHRYLVLQGIDGAVAGHVELAHSGPRDPWVAV